MKKGLVKIVKTFSDEDLRNLQGELMEEEIESMKASREPHDRYFNPPITLNGDTGRDDTPKPYFNWVIQGTDPQKMLKINKIFLDALRTKKATK
jgi:hypothetical protein